VGNHEDETRQSQTRDYVGVKFVKRLFQQTPEGQGNPVNKPK